MAAAVLKDGTVRRRPMFAYPVQARYRGRGDMNDPRNFVGHTPPPVNDLYDWAGATAAH
jgi:feruloyl esterase